MRPETVAYMHKRGGTSLDEARQDVYMHMYMYVYV
jgi:hypothetical protein